ncbi:hypothetical protein FRC07_008803 [Ceratobasidium sp. 392]|nr:hypothetical protein FRC07_008803 [Ceratobasidium sp. 392]
MLEWRRSDGDKSRRRPRVSLTRNVDAEGNVNYYREIPDTEEVSVVWRREIGTYVAKKLGYPTGKVYWMKGWPSGYGFFDHQKGKLPNPRHDLYLCGMFDILYVVQHRQQQRQGSASTMRFRSKNEFLPHALWLMTDPALDSVCGCKYCSKTKSQVEVNQDLGLPGLKHAPEGQARVPTKAKIVTSSKTHQPAAALPERTLDLTSSDHSFRECELVWVSLKNPIYLTPDRSVAIDLWPAIVLSFSTRNTPSNHGPGDSNYTIGRRCVYTIRLLAVDHLVRVYEERLLPQLGYVPSLELINVLKDCEPPRPLDVKFEEYRNFNPLPEFNKDLNISPSQYSSQDALPAYYLALHIVACLTPLWCATHSYASEKLKSQEQYFQGIWWGAERIWLGDLVRLKPPREELDKDGALGLLPPSCPDALMRGLFLHITYIVADSEDPSEGGISVAGNLYELSVDSEEPKPKPQSTSGSRSMFGAPTGLVGGPAAPQSSVAGPSRTQPERDTFGQGQRSYALLPVPLGSPPVVEATVSMPEPPPGYVFRRPLQPGGEIMVDVSAIAGRYYPSILSMETVDTAMRAVNEEYGQAKRCKTIRDERKPMYRAGTIDAYAGSRLDRRASDIGGGAYEGAGTELVHLLSLAGLFLADGNAMEPEQRAEDRLTTIQSAEENGRKVLFDGWKEGASSDIEMADG